MDDSRRRKTSASPHYQSVSSSDEEGGRERDLGLFALLSAAATIDPVVPVVSSVVVVQEAACQHRSALNDIIMAARESSCDANTPTPTITKSTSDNKEAQSTCHSLKRQAPISNVSDDFSKIFARLQPTRDEINSTTTKRSERATLNWYDRLKELYVFRAAYGHADVPQQYPKNRPLGIWVNKQRMQKRLFNHGERSSLTNHRVKLLDEVGFQWAKEKGDVSWDQHYRELYEFYLQNDHCNVPTKYAENKALGRWVSTQRSQLKKWKHGSYSLMTEERYEKLVKLDFLFEPKNKNADGDSDN